MTASRQFLEVELEVDEAWDGGGRVSAEVMLVWSGVVVEERLPVVQETLKSAIETVVRAHPAPDTIGKAPSSLVRAIHDESNERLGAIGVQGELVDMRFANIRVSVQPVREPGLLENVAALVGRSVPPSPAIDVNATAFGVAPLTDDALPFQDAGAHVPAPAPSASSLPDHEATGATVGVGDLRAEDIFPEETPEMSLEQYASLCVERALNPGQEGEVAARYRILTEAALRQLDEQWRGRFAREGELHQRFQQAYAQYQAWLRQQRGDG